MLTHPDLTIQDPIIAQAIDDELARQRTGLEMIPSENFVSLAVLEALGSVAQNKYAEGYPGKRYYGGCQFIDVIEQTAIDRAKELFGAEHANVQPLSGASMNVAVYSALLKPGDTILGMDLGHGGHLTHGHPVTFMSKVFNFVRYTCDPLTGKIDMDEVRRLAHEHKPKLVLCGFSAYSRELPYEEFAAIAKEVGAYSMMDMAHIGGLVAAGVTKNPVPIMDVVTTTTHKTLRGPRGAMILCKKEIAKKIDKAVFPGLQGGPHEHQIAAIAVALKEAMQPEFKIYGAQTIANARALAQTFLDAGIALIYGGTDNHLLMIDVTQFNLAGHEAEVLLDAVGITVNKNMIPNETRSALDPSGIRMGTPALTTRGMREGEMTQIGEMIIQLFKNPTDTTVQATARELVKKLTEQFPLYS